MYGLNGKTRARTEGDVSMRIEIDRRRLLAGLFGAAGAALWPRRVSGQRPAMRLILLGTGGGPRPKKTMSAPAYAIVIGDATYLVDCGDGVARQFVLAGVPLTSLRHIFITHHHSDHNADYGNVLLIAWASGLATRVDAWGPPPLEEMTRLFFQMNAFDIETRMADEGRRPLAPLVHAHERREGGLVFEDERVKVTAALVPHPPVTPAFAYRFDAPDRSIVFSGDTTRSDELVRLAKGADILVHEALYPPAVDRLVATVPNASTLRKHIIDSHTTIEDVGRVAEAAGVKTLVLSHLVPGEDPLVTDSTWLEAASAHFRGKVIVGRDLMEL